jgi:large subunit ribosomal protein L4
MRRLALRSALSAKARDGELFVIDDLGLTAPRTKDIVAMLGAFGLQGSAMLVTAEPEAAVKQSTANVGNVKTVSAPYLNVADLMNHRHLIMTEAAVRSAEQLWGGERATRRRQPAVQGAA